MPFFEHDNLKFHYLEHGKGIPVVFQHGLGSDTEKIFAQVELPPGYRLLGLDCRAHGKTEPVGPVEQLRFDTFADDLMELLGHLGIAEAIVGGTSMGAGVALNCALRYPQRVSGLVLLRPAWLDHPNQANLRLFGAIAQLLRRHGPKAGLARFLQSPEYQAIARESTDTAESLRTLFQEARALEAVARLEQIPTDAPSRDRAVWRSIRQPVLILATRADPVHPIEFGQVLAGEIPGARFQELTPKSSDLNQYLSELRQALAGFLQSRFPGPSPRTG